MGLFLIVHYFQIQNLPHPHPNPPPDGEGTLRQKRKSNRTLLVPCNIIFFAQHVGRFKRSGTGDNAGYGSNAGSVSLDPAYEEISVTWY